MPHAKLTYEDLFYKKLCKGKFVGTIKGFPLNNKGGWCKKLKYENSSVNIPRLVLQGCREEYKEQRENLGLPDSEGELVHLKSQDGCSEKFLKSPMDEGRDIKVIQYLGIAADEPERIKRHSVEGKELPLVLAGWDEAYCRGWCEERGVLSPIYTTATRGGCWFCHNQGIEQLRLLRKNYPDLWALLLKWDSDSPVTFKSDGHTVHDYDKRFALEDCGVLIPGDRRFRWKNIE